MRGFSIDTEYICFHTDGNLAESEIQKASEGQRVEYPEGIEECGTDALRLTFLSYLTQVTAAFVCQNLACKPFNSTAPAAVHVNQDCPGLLHINSSKLDGSRRGQINPVLIE